MTSWRDMLFWVAVVAAWAGMLLWITGCAMWINEDEFGWEFGASSNHTRTVERREIRYPTGIVVVDEGIEEEAAENEGLSENAKDAWQLPFKVLLPLAKGAAGVP